MYDMNKYFLTKICDHSFFLNKEFYTKMSIYAKLYIHFLHAYDFRDMQVILGV
jgi:hypothetical protein